MLDVPEPERIRALPMGELIALRAKLLTHTNARAPVHLVTYESILNDTLSIALLLKVKEEHTMTLPPEPEWARALEPVDADDQRVLTRIRALIAVGLDDDEICETLSEEFIFNENDIQT